MEGKFRVRSFTNTMCLCQVSFTAIVVEFSLLRWKLCLRFSSMVMSVARKQVNYMIAHTSLKLVSRNV